MPVRIVIYVLACLLLGAHFLRQGNLIVTGLCLLAPCLLFIKKRWVLRLSQGVAYTSALVWLYTTYVLVRQRMMFDAPWLRMLLILLGVTALTALAGYLLSSDVVKRRYS